jgi:hypothetical protein
MAAPADLSPATPTKRTITTVPATPTMTAAMPALYFDQIDVDCGIAQKWIRYGNR